MPRVHIPLPVPPGAKYCLCCRAVKPLAEFRRDRDATDGLRRYCAPCARAKHKASMFKAAYNKLVISGTVKRITGHGRLTRAEEAALFVDADGASPSGRAARDATPCPA